MFFFCKKISEKYECHLLAQQLCYLIYITYLLIKLQKMSLRQDSGSAITHFSIEHSHRFSKFIIYWSYYKIIASLGVRHIHE